MYLVLNENSEAIHATFTKKEARELVKRYKEEDGRAMTIRGIKNQPFWSIKCKEWHIRLDGDVSHIDLDHDWSADYAVSFCPFH